METVAGTNNKTAAVKPTAAVFVDFEHWYISMEKLHHTKPNIKAWYNALEEQYEVREVVFFADFSHSGIRSELAKIRSVTNMVIDSQNPSLHYKKDFTDFIMLDYIYQKALLKDDSDVYILFTGDGHFSSVVRFLITKCHKTVGLFGVRDAISSQLREDVSWYIEMPDSTSTLSRLYPAVIDAYEQTQPSVRRGIEGTRELVSLTAKATGEREDLIAKAITEMMRLHYLYEMDESKGIGQKTVHMNWERLVLDGLWKPEPEIDDPFESTDNPEQHASGTGRRRRRRRRHSSERSTDGAS